MSAPHSRWNSAPGSWVSAMPSTTLSLATIALPCALCPVATRRIFISSLLCRRRRQCIIGLPLTVIVSLLALGFLILVAYRGYSVILFAPVAALGAVLLTMPGAVLPAYSALFMDSMATFLKNYFPVFMLGALFGKLIEVSGFAKAIAAGISRVTGRGRAMLGIVTICALMVYGGVSVIVIAFAVYPFAAELFRAADIPKRLI